MKKEVKLVNKVKYLLRKIGAPTYLHHFGPKLYKLWQHVFALFVRTQCRLSFVNTASFLRGLGFKVATKSTLQRYAAKLALPFWQSILARTIRRISKIGAIDGTGMQRTSASWHYIKRIDGAIPRTGYKLSIFSAKNTVLSLRIRAKNAHDVKDVKYLLKNAAKRPTIVLMDKGYDAEWLHKYCNHQLNIKSIIPLRKNSFRGYFRKKLIKNFPQKLYNKRSRAESLFHALKTKFGASVSSKHIGPARTEMYCRAILHNIFLRIIQVLG